MAEWIYFIHPPREDFAATMTDEEPAVWSIHFARFSACSLTARSSSSVRPRPDEHRIAIFEAPDEPRRGSSWTGPVIAGGFARGELRPFRVSLLRGRDGWPSVTSGTQPGRRARPAALPGRTTAGRCRSRRSSPPIGASPSSPGARLPPARSHRPGPPRQRPAPRRALAGRARRPGQRPGPVEAGPAVAVVIRRRIGDPDAGRRCRPRRRPPAARGRCRRPAADRGSVQHGPLPEGRLRRPRRRRSGARRPPSRR